MFFCTLLCPVLSIGLLYIDNLGEKLRRFGQTSKSKFPTCRPGCRPYLFKSISNLSVPQFQPRISYIHMQGVTLPSRNYHDAITIKFPHFPIDSSEIVDLRVIYHREKHIIFSKLSKQKKSSSQLSHRLIHFSWPI